MFQSGIWQLKVNSVNDSFSVAVVIQNPQYHKLHCIIFKEHGDIFLKATVEPPFENLELLDISWVYKLLNCTTLKCANE